MNANLVLIGRNRSAGQAVLRRLQRRGAHSTVDFICSDLSRQSDVRALAAQIRLKYERVDVLVNNAGARIDEYRETDDGIEATFATNHLSHFLLTCLLFDRLVRTPDSRVVTVASGAHFGTTAQGDWCLTRANYNRQVAYAKSKLANVMFAYELARRAKPGGLLSNAVDPGLVFTNFARNNGFIPWLRFMIAHAIRRELVLSTKGAETIVYLATSPEVNGVTGKYFRRNQQTASSEWSYDHKEAERLWNLSAQLTHVKDDIPHATFLVN
jgi:NAD(P)-dependent dehydrogenase (short-subunit alcohol dehydrogenase family)